MSDQCMVAHQYQSFLYSLFHFYFHFHFYFTFIFILFFFIFHSHFHFHLYFHFNFYFYLIFIFIFVFIFISTFNFISTFTFIFISFLFFIPHFKIEMVRKAQQYQFDFVKKSKIEKPVWPISISINIRKIINKLLGIIVLFCNVERCE